MATERQTRRGFLAAIPGLAIAASLCEEEYGWRMYDPATGKWYSVKDRKWVDWPIWNPEGSEVSER